MVSGNLRFLAEKRQPDCGQGEKDTTKTGVYIPRNIEECFLQLDTLLSPHLRSLIRNSKSIKEIDGLHFGPGMWIRNNWGLWCGSRLQTYLLKRGLNHPDEMSGVIFDYYWDYLHGIDERWRAFDAMRTKP